MFVLERTREAIANNDDPYMVCALAIILVVTVAVLIWVIREGK